jgi:hypothetical protein
MSDGRLAAIPDAAIGSKSSACHLAVQCMTEGQS